MNISKTQQRVLHTLAQGGRILIFRDDGGALASVDCYSRDGWKLGGFGLDLFRLMKRRRWIMSRDGGPYLITRDGLEQLRPQLDNRVSTRRW